MGASVNSTIHTRNARSVQPCAVVAKPLRVFLAAHGGVVELCHVHERSLPAPPYLYDRQEGKLSEAERACLESQLRALVPRRAADGHHHAPLGD
jgi:hypothetical protein